MRTTRAFDATIGIGSNVGDKRANISRAIDLLTATGDVRLAARSRDYRSEPWGVMDQDWFVNACVGVVTDLSARDLLDRCQRVESTMGRVRKQKWGPRIIDLDLLTYRKETISEPDLVVPHPLIAQRAFVLMPLHEIAPGLTLGGRKLSEFLASIDPTGCVPLGEAGETEPRDCSKP